MGYESLALNSRKAKKKKPWYMILIHTLLIIISIILLFGVAILVFFTVVEYRPKKLEEAKIINNQINLVKFNEEYQALTFNIGYGSLGKDEDFVMDGGKKGIPESREVVEGYLAGIKDIINTYSSEFYFIQEVDINSRRSYKINQQQYILDNLGTTYNSTFALNYKALFVPFPFSFTQYMGKVESGVSTFTNFKVENSERHQFPGGFSWPVRTVNLKRGMLVNYHKIEGSDKMFVVVNLHMSAYDSSGKLREQEMAYLKDFMIEHKKIGNYVLIGGDFNQTFPEVSLEVRENPYFTPYKIEDTYLPEGYQFKIDPNVTTSRLLNQPYNPSDIENTYYFIIDGFIVSDNIEVTLVEGLDLGYVHSDHNPVRLKFKLVE